MKAEIKTALVQKLKSMGDEKIIIHKQHPIIHVLIDILQELHPDENFGDLGNHEARRRCSEALRECKTHEERQAVYSTPGMLRGIGWDNIMKFSGLNRIDFFIDLTEYTYQFKRENKSPSGEIEVTEHVDDVRIRSHSGSTYIFPTISSLILSLRGGTVQRPVYFRTIGEIIEQHYVENK